MNTESQERTTMKRIHLRLAGVALTVLLAAVGIRADDHAEHSQVKGCAAGACAVEQPAHHNMHIAKALRQIAAARAALNNGDTDAALAGLAAAEQALLAVRPPVGNTSCPIMGNAIDPKNVKPSLYRTFQGKGVGFCCAGCPAAWDKLSDEAKAEKVKSAMPAPPAEDKSSAAPAEIVNTVCPIMGTKIDPDKVPAKLTRRFQGKTVGFCCAGCPAAWDKLSDEAKTEKLQAAR
jgi:hypothetical protein